MACLRKLPGRVTHRVQLHPLVERHPRDLDPVAGQHHPVAALGPVHSRRVSHCCTRSNASFAYSEPGLVYQREAGPCGERC